MKFSQCFSKCQNFSRLAALIFFGFASVFVSLNANAGKTVQLTLNDQIISAEFEFGRSVILKCVHKEKTDIIKMDGPVIWYNEKITENTSLEILTHFASSHCIDAIAIMNYMNSYKFLSETIYTSPRGIEVLATLFFEHTPLSLKANIFELNTNRLLGSAILEKTSRNIFWVRADQMTTTDVFALNQIVATYKDQLKTPEVPAAIAPIATAESTPRSEKTKVSEPEYPQQAIASESVTKLEPTTSDTPTIISGSVTSVTDEN